VINNNKEYLGSKDVAWILDLSPDDVVELARKQKLLGTKTGRFWRFRRDDVETYKEQQQKSE
jgi:excisionase family DNA binding protein